MPLDPPLPAAGAGAPLGASLRGIRVLDFTRVLAGPLCTQILADLGAEVLKVESPSGDETRRWGPPFAGDESAYFLCLNRNKASLVLDLKREEDQSLARRLAARADVVIENFRVGWMAGQGLDVATLWSVNPRLVYCSISAYGQEGPDAQLPGYDFITQGRCGLMAITGDPHGPPMKVGVAVVDQLTGLYAAVGILAGLRGAQASGRGCYVDLGLLDCGAAGLLNVASNWLIGGSDPGRLGNEHPNIVPYAVFDAADGPFILAAGNDRHWRQVCRVLGDETLASDPRFRTNAARVEHRALLKALLEERFQAAPREEWLRRLAAAGVPAGPVQSVRSALEDPQLQARNMLCEAENASAGPVRMLVNPLLREATPAAPPPSLGQGGRETAERWLQGVTEPRTVSPGSCGGSSGS